MSSFENVEIFEDTKNLCEKNGRIKESLAKSVKNLFWKENICLLWINHVLQIMQK